MTSYDPRQNPGHYLPAKSANGDRRNPVDLMPVTPCPHCWGDTETIDFHQLTHPVIVCIDCGAMAYTKPEDTSNAEKNFNHHLLTSVEFDPNPCLPGLGNGDRP